MPTCFLNDREISFEPGRTILDVARENVARHQLAHRVQLLESSLFERIGDQRFDLIVSNPPYVPQPELQQLPEEFRHEPVLGLSAGEDGLDVVVQILKNASQYLAENGILVVEVGCSQESLVELYPEIAFLWLEFEQGGEGVFLLEQDQLRKHQHDFDRVATLRSGEGDRTTGFTDYG